MVSVLPDIQAGGWQVERSSIDDGQDFFTYQPEDFDVIVSNPPYTQKDRVIERLYELEKPFAVLLPLNSLQGVGRYRYFKNGIQILTFDKRIGFHNAESMEEYKKGSSFATAYFCRDILPRDLILEELREYRKPLKESCPDRNAPADRCEGCGTHGNIQDLEQLIESMKEGEKGQ